MSRPRIPDEAVGGLMEGISKPVPHHKLSDDELRALGYVPLGTLTYGSRATTPYGNHIVVLGREEDRTHVGTGPHGRTIMLHSKLVLPLLLLLLVFTACTPCYPNHSGVCEGPPLSPAEQAAAERAYEELKARADTSSHIDLGGPP